MGDPASIRFWEDTKDEHPLGLYLHWGAAAYAQDLANALETTRDRWDDPEYATRMAIQHILKARHIDAEDLGAGLYVGATSEFDGRVLNVNWGSKVVWTDEWRVPFDGYLVSPDLWEKVQS